MAKRKWFVSHPSSGRNHSPTFFAALDQFAEMKSNKFELIYPESAAEGLEVTKNAIEKSDLVIAEVSLASTGSGIEMGWANAFGKTVIAFHHGATSISPSVQFVATAIHAYLGEDDIIAVLETLV